MMSCMGCVLRDLSPFVLCVELRRIGVSDKHHKQFRMDIELRSVVWSIVLDYRA